MRLRDRVILATVLTVATCAVAWLVCLRFGLDGDSTGTVVGLVAFAVGTPLTVWAGLEDEAKRGAFAWMDLRVVLPVAARRRALRATTLVVAAVLLGGDVPASVRLLASGEVALLDLDDGPGVVIPLRDGGVAVCGRRDRRWLDPVIEGKWVAPQGASAFFSTYRGIEVIGHSKHTLVFGWRDSSHRWNGPDLVKIDGLTVQDVEGRASFLQMRPYEKIRFLAFAPRRRGGIALVERPDHETKTPFVWRWRGEIGKSAGRVDAITVVQIGGESRFVAVLRSGERLIRLERAPRPVAPIHRGWKAMPLRLDISTGSVTGNPVAVVTDVTVDSPGMIRLLVPVKNGLIMATASAVDSGSWVTERLPVTGLVDSVSVTDGEEGGHKTIEVIYRQGSAVFQLWRDHQGQWRDPARLVCG